MSNNVKRNKPGFNVSLHIVLTEVFLTLTTIVAIIALVLACADIDVESLSLSLEKSATILGFFVSAFGLVIGGYFVVLAVNAYSHANKITQLVELSDEFKDKYEKHEKNIIHIINVYSNYIYEDISEHISSVGNSRSNEDIIRERFYLRQKRARLIFLLPTIQQPIFEKLLLELGEIGNDEDLKKLKAEREEYGEGRRHLVGYIIAYMEDRLYNSKENKS